VPRCVTDQRQGERACGSHWPWEALKTVSVAPGRQFPASVIEGRDLARLINLPEAKLQQLGVRAQLPFSFNPSVGIWIRRSELPQWQRAANAYRGG